VKTDQTAASRLTAVENLNSTSLSKNVMRLFREAKQTPEPGLLVVSLLLWAKDNPKGRDPAWLQDVADAAAQAEAENPQATYENLASPALEQAVSLDGAVSLTLRMARDFIAPE
jgi:hypothetical protein